MSIQDNSSSVSIIIPFFKGEQLISKLVKSLHSAIRRVENLPVTFEVILIVDSPESDGMKLEEYFDEGLKGSGNVSVVIKRNEVNLGVASSRNVALLLATGDYIHIIDQDDQIEDSFYLRIIPLLTKYNFILVNGKVQYDREAYKTHLIYYFQPLLALKNLILDDFIRSPGQVVFSKEMAEHVSFPVTLTYKGADDKFFWVSMFYTHLRSIKPFYVKEPLYIANIHSSNYSADNQNLQLSCLENWSLLTNQHDFGNYNTYVRRNVNYLRFITSTSDNLQQKLSGLKEWLIYATDLNKITRYIIKRR